MEPQAVLIWQAACLFSLRRIGYFCRALAQLMPFAKESEQPSNMLSSDAGD
jgi:hypothetical protein